MQNKYSRGIWTAEAIELDKWWDEEIETSNKLFEEKEIIEKARLETLANLNAWNQFKAKSFQTDLIEYQKTKDKYFFEDNIYPVLRGYTHMLSKSYILKLPMKARQLFLSETNSNDYSEFLHEIMWYAVRNWQPNITGKHGGSVSFKGYYEILVKRHHIAILRKFNRKYMKNVEIILTNFDEDGEKNMYKKMESNVQLNGQDLLDIEKEFTLSNIDKYYKLTNSNKYVFAQHFVDFVKELDKTEAAMLYMLIEDNLTHEKMAMFLKVEVNFLKTIRRHIQQKWIKFNEGKEI